MRKFHALAFEIDFSCCRFGVLAIELFSGTKPWAELSMAQVITRVVVQKLHPPIPSTVPAELAALFADCMAFDAAKRPPVNQIIDRLKHLRDVLLSSSELSTSDVCLLTGGFAHGFQRPHSPDRSSPSRPLPPLSLPPAADHKRSPRHEIDRCCYSLI